MFYCDQETVLIPALLWRWCVEPSHRRRAVLGRPVGDIQPRGRLGGGPSVDIAGTIPFVEPCVPAAGPFWRTVLWRCGGAVVGATAPLWSRAVPQTTRLRQGRLQEPLPFDPYILVRPSLMILVGILVFYGFAKPCNAAGIHKDRIEILERIDFGFAFATIVTGGWLFLGKLWSGSNSGTSHPRSPGKKRGTPNK